MKRAAGTMKDKKNLLSALTPSTFPYLVADILSYVLGHKNVKVMDGPGDGRRDIHSVFLNGEPGITQCKHHSNETAVSSRETDEIVISLTKFGHKNGIFATTGSVSPQAKREYLDNFKGFNLELWDADDIVNFVLTNHVLRAYWLNSEKITDASNQLIFPFTVRDPSTDTPVVEEIVEALQKSGNFEFQKYRGDQTLFHPYRVPAETSIHEDGGLHLTCWTARTNAGVYQVDKLRNKLLDDLCHSLSPFQHLRIRFGFPCVSSGDDDLGLTKITKFTPDTYVLMSGKMIPEKEYVLPRDARWCFPDNLSALEAPWAGWLNRSTESVLLINIEEPRQSKPTPYELAKHKWDQQNLMLSLYLGGEHTGIESFIRSLDPTSQADEAIEYGYGGAILFWKHPNIKREEERGFGYRIDKKGGLSRSIPK